MRLAILIAVGQLDDIRTKPFDIDDGYSATGINPFDLRAWFEIFEFCHTIPQLF
jgi:hypothetical protein